MPFVCLHREDHVGVPLHNVAAVSDTTRGIGLQPVSYWLGQPRVGKAIQSLGAEKKEIIGRVRNAWLGRRTDESTPESAATGSEDPARPG